MGFPYKRHCAGPFEVLGPGVHFGSEFDCLLGVLVHTRIDALMCPHFWSLLPLSVFDWVVIAVSVCDAMTPLNTLIHPVSIISTTLCAIFTGLSSFQLVPMSTVPDVEGLHHRKHKATGATHRRSRVAYITYITGNPYHLKMLCGQSILQFLKIAHSSTMTINSTSPFVSSF